MSSQREGDGRVTAVEAVKKHLKSVETLRDEAHELVKASEKSVHDAVALMITFREGSGDEGVGREAISGRKKAVEDLQKFAKHLLDTAVEESSATANVGKGVNGEAQAALKDCRTAVKGLRKSAEKILELAMEEVDDGAELDSEDEDLDTKAGVLAAMKGRLKSVRRLRDLAQKLVLDSTEELKRVEDKIELYLSEMDVDDASGTNNNEEAGAGNHTGRGGDDSGNSGGQGTQAQQQNPDEGAGRPTQRNRHSRSTHSSGRANNERIVQVTGATNENENGAVNAARNSGNENESNLNAVESPGSNRTATIPPRSRSSGGHSNNGNEGDSQVTGQDNSRITVGDGRSGVSDMDTEMIEQDNEENVNKNKNQGNSAAAQDGSVDNDGNQEKMQHGEEEQVRQKLLANTETPIQQSKEVEPTRDHFWERKFQQLSKFRAEQGHCMIPQSNKPLWNWVRRMRKLRSKNRIPAHRVRLLEAVGFFEGSEGVRDEMWEKHFAELVEFNAMHGHCEVPSQYPDNPQLSHWAKRQHEMRTDQDMPEDRVQCLDALGFWPITSADTNDAKQQCKSGGKKNYLGKKKNRSNIHDEKWEKRFAELAEFKASHGHCEVPSNEPQLGRWAAWQREMYKVKNLREDRAQRLEELGFRLEFRTASKKAKHNSQSDSKNSDGDKNKKKNHEEKWEKHFAELVEFKTVHGHCEISKNKPQLARWANRQRVNHKLQTLPKDRIQRLEALGFRLSTLAARKSNAAKTQSQSGGGNLNAHVKHRMARLNEDVELEPPRNKKSLEYSV